jgi:flavodoxin
MAQIGIFFGSKTEMTTNAGDIIKNEMESYGHLTDMFDFKMRGFGPKPNFKIMRFVRKW